MMYFTHIFYPGTLSPGTIWLLVAINLLVLLLLLLSIILLIQERKSRMAEERKNARAYQTQQYTVHQRQGLELRQARKQIQERDSEIEYLLHEIQQLRELAQGRTPGRKSLAQQEEAACLFLQQQKDQEELYLAIEKAIPCSLSLSNAVFLETVSNAGPIDRTPSTESLQPMDWQRLIAKLRGVQVLPLGVD